MSFLNIEESEVAAYYNNNTSRFIRDKKSNTTGTIHRRLYSDETLSEDPAHVSDTIILNCIKTDHAEKILDLGCGTGASIRFLQDRYKSDYTGITVSPVQYKIAEAIDADIELGSYLDSEWYNGRGPFDVIYAIESLQHNPNHNILFDNLQKVMKRTSRLIIIDDFIIENEIIGVNEKRLIERFKKHWHAFGFTTVRKFIETADTGGLELIETSDLSGLMKKRFLNPKIRAAALFLLSILPLRNSWLDNLIGGGTLILLQQLNLAGYYKLVFRPQ